MKTPADPSEPKPPALRTRPLGFAAGLGAGVILWGIITVATANVWLGALFGLAPGLAIGVGLHATARR
ncbi:hypothetical protein [Maricaulis sp.]|uniref:hypothetical protein n=1 Tax=Maricaulis sp. TaxID=1486257 RepID=UPI0026021E44|nr:hypothetical protein [Maricaulis sp.]